MALGINRSLPPSSSPFNSNLLQGDIKVLFCRTCWINLFPLPRRGCSTNKGVEGVVRGHLTPFRPPGRSQNEVRWWSEYHLALRQRAAALCTPAWGPLARGGRSCARSPRAPATGGHPLHSGLGATFTSPWLILAVWLRNPGAHGTLNSCG